MTAVEGGAEGRCGWVVVWLAVRREVEMRRTEVGDELCEPRDGLGLMQG